MLIGDYRDTEVYTSGGIHSINLEVDILGEIRPWGKYWNAITWLDYLLMLKNAVNVISIKELIGKLWTISGQ